MLQWQELLSGCTFRLMLILLKFCCSSLLLTNGLHMCEATLLGRD